MNLFLIYLKANTNYLSGSDITEIWYREGKNYSYDGKFNKNSGHFSQIVWKDTKKLGVGFSQTDDGNFFAVFYYIPAGNYKNEFNKNVLRPLEQNDAKKTVNNSSSINKSKAPEPPSAIRVNPDSLQVQPVSCNSKSNFSPVQNRFINEALEQHNECKYI